MCTIHAARCETFLCVDTALELSSTCSAFQYLLACNCLAQPKLAVVVEHMLSCMMYAGEKLSINIDDGAKVSARDMMADEVSSNVRTWEQCTANTLL